MKATLVLLAVAVSVVIALPAEDKYSTKYDNVDLDEIFRNERLLQNYVNCLLDKGNCSPDGKLLKEALPDALTNECQKCSEKQKHGSEKAIKFLIENKKAIFDELQKKYDPSGIYLKKYEENLKSLNVKQ